ncbi:UDP-N-acetylmuramate:L-alanyl-gamma-D-glutamyl-meso-diaminopimelate ligase [Mesosutterella sp. AGMB02718]|uniref:UDP-N-acetylmuramate--L-alanyl-gamma-D-glutamyl-meso-2,6-diaminoheptandioate ligase n=1 Tax=Mesosutterella faecium TaxID=2925194 RepID=A0ABT7IJQ2_9BURK|nr:UDP-N-acetylmuramate:L-alanyl-gamma-D-glutamyl-meso-diaminopimelate ligase [Mesosutterella sp. AGMB02718]MDL2058600.1 UDP-N-acetylmuramate:L-alanyl-gamma-D-glutamyl-meso-diaminopimelate ligase [Mesosutterella sp. AGMB02718]
MHIHILGICGTFMGGVAQLAAQAGHTVTGCDAGVYPPMSDQLREAGIRLYEGYGADQLAVKPDLWVIGNAISRGNPLLEAILDAGLPYTSGPQWISEHILQGRHVLTVAGTHGKTTTSSILAWMLESAGKKPGFLIGGVPGNFGHSARLSPQSPYFVIEGDEYDTCFFDKRSKFVHYRPKTAVLNNLEYDHADIFDSVEAIEKSFHHLVRTMASNALIVANGRSETLKKVIGMGCWSRLEWFDDPSGWTISEDGEVALRGESLGVLHSPLLGRHNALNTLAALAAARSAGVSPREALEAMPQFAGVKRRLEVKGTEHGVVVIDDFAHHPTAIRETIAALRGRMGRGSGRLIAILEPRSNTMKMGTLRAQLPGSLSDADQVYCYAGPAVRWDVAEALAPLGEKAHVYHDLEPLVREAVAWSKPGDRMLVMSNGGFGGIHGRLLAALKARESAK